MRQPRGAKLAIVLATVALLAAGCGSTVKKTTVTTAAPQKISVVVTTTQLADFVNTLGGSHFDVYDIAKTGVDPHNYVLTPADIAAMNNADVLIGNGAGLDIWFDNQIADQKPKGTVVDASVGITLRPSSDPESRAGDPHIWNSIANAKVMVSNVRKALAAADATDASEFASTERGYDSQLDGFITDSTTSFAPLANKVLLTDHDAFEYFCDEFALTCAGSVIPTSGKPAVPTSAQISAVAVSLKNSGAVAVFSQATGSPAVAEELATDLGVKIEEGNNGLYADSLGAAGGDADTYLKAQRHNVDVIVANLQAAVAGPAALTTTTSITPTPIN